MRLVDLAAKFTQHLPLADGIYTGLYYLCPNDPRRKKGHAVLFTPIINPHVIEGVPPEALLAYLNSNPGYRASPKWQRTGDTIETLTLKPSIAFACCHVNIENGGVAP